MKVKLHQDVEGHKANDEIDVPKDRAEWLVAQGYASIEGDKTDKTLVTDVSADKDPTLAANQPADEDGQDDPKPHEVFANMVEDPETGESGNVETKAPMQSIGNTEAKASQAKDDLASDAAVKANEAKTGTTPKTAK